MKFAVAVILALAMAVNARQLTWTAEQMKAMGYPAPASHAVATAEAVAISHGKPYVAPEPVQPQATYYGNPYPAAPVEVEPEVTVPYYGKPVVDPVAVDPVDPYNGYYVQPEVDDTATDPVACFYKKVFTCDAPEEVSPTCGTEACALPNLCLTVKKTQKKMIEVPVTVCENPKLVCKEIKKECGDKYCAYDENCKVSKTCKKVAAYGYGYAYPTEDVDYDYEAPATYPAPAAYPAYPYPYPTDVSPEESKDKATAVASAKAVATSDGGDASANAKAVANAGSRRRMLGAHASYPDAYPTYPTYAAPEEYDDAATDPAYGAYKVVCEDTYECETVDPTVCKTVTHEVCVKKPVTSEPGYYSGYKMDWASGYVVGQKCGDSVCDPGSFCATCEVEVCKDAVMEKDAAQCGVDANGAPTFCPAGHMCTELCAPVKKYIAVEVEVPVCVDPLDATYADDVAAVVTQCGPHQCLPGYECNETPVKVCGGVPEEVDPEEEKQHGYYFWYDTSAADPAAEAAIPGYYCYPHGAAGDASGCGCYIYAQPDIVVEDVAAKPDPYAYPYTYAAPEETKDEAASVPFYYYPVDNTATEPYYEYPADPWVAKPADPWVAKPADPWVKKPADPWVKKPADPWVKKPADPWVEKPVDPWVEKPADPWVEKPADPWVEKPAKKSSSTVTAVAKSNGDGVWVGGSSDTTGDASGSFWAGASNGEDTKATIDGYSGPTDTGAGEAGVECNAKSKDGKVADCDGTATHTN